ncbi:MAG: hypothetical protein K2X90_01895 [Candidatus Babeliaceae bacterium]|nr:hypothetical protein [Candidatus Babeliaceae bacterium]
MYTSILKAIFFCSISIIFCESFVIEKPQTRKPLHMALIYEDSIAQQAAQNIKKLFMSTGLFEITLSAGSAPKAKQEIMHYVHKGFSAVLFLQQLDNNKMAYRLYDVTDASMLVGKTISSTSQDLTQRLIADGVYTHLFNHASYFLTKIAYVKKSPTIRNKKRTELCMLDPVDGLSQTIVKDNRILVAPQWSHIEQDLQEKIWISVSEFTPSNVRLLGLDLHGNSWPILDLAGTCVGTAQQNESTFVYVRSGVLWLYEFDKKNKKGYHTKLTDSKNTCGCPSLLKSGDIIYSCNNKIYRYDRYEKKSYQLPINGNCSAPDVHKLTDRIIFSRNVKGIQQLHSSDANGKNITQLTFGSGNKIDACWSSCGNYIVYTRCEGPSEQIAIYNLMTQTEKILTPTHQHCGYPSWSASNIQFYS